MHWQILSSVCPLRNHVRLGPFSTNNYPNPSPSPRPTRSRTRLYLAERLCFKLSSLLRCLLCFSLSLNIICWVLGRFPGGGGGGTPIHGLDRYVPPDSGVMEGLYHKNRVSFLPLLARVVFLVWSLYRLPFLYQLRIQVHKCSATLETNHLLKVDFTLEHYESN